MNQSMSVTGFLWGKWEEEDDDGLNLLIITPERQAQERRVLAYLDQVKPSRIDGGGKAYYSLAVLEDALRPPAIVTT